MEEGGLAWTSVRFFYILNPQKCRCVTTERDWKERHPSAVSSLTHTTKLNFRLCSAVAVKWCLAVSSISVGIEAQHSAHSGRDCRLIELNSETFFELILNPSTKFWKVKKIVGLRTTSCEPKMSIFFQISRPIHWEKSQFLFGKLGRPTWPRDNISIEFYCERPAHVFLFYWLQVVKRQQELTFWNIIYNCR